MAVTPKRRRSYYVLQALIFAIDILVLFRYGVAEYAALLAVEILAYSQGIDRGTDIARSAYRTAMKWVLH